MLYGIVLLLDMEIVRRGKIWRESRRLRRIYRRILWGRAVWGRALRSLGVSDNQLNICRSVVLYLVRKRHLLAGMGSFDRGLCLRVWDDHGEG